MKTVSRLPEPMLNPAPAVCEKHSSGSPFHSLRIAFLVPEDRQTGTYFRYHNLAVALRQIGHQVTVYSQSSTNRFRQTREIRDGVPYVLSATAPGNRWILPATNPITFLRRLLVQVEEADVYHLFQPFPSAAIAWKWLRKRRNGLFVYDWDDYWINDEFGLRSPRGFRARWAAFWIGRMEKTLPAICDLATTVSHPLADLALKRNCPRSTVLYNGIWPTVPKPKLLARKQLNLKADAFYVGLMGWTGEVDWCLEAMRRFSPGFPNLRLAISGMDPSENLKEYPEILERVDYLGTLPPERFSYFNSCLDLGLVPMSTSDFNRYRLPFKLTDHLSGGVPVLCSRIGEAALIADDLDGLYMCEPTLDAWLKGFKETVSKLQSENDGKRPSPEALLKRFSWVKIALEMSQLYLEGLGLSCPSKKP